jgi:hypothetical protein
MASKCAILAFVLAAAIGGYALPLYKRAPSQDVFDSYVYGVEVNGLFNPMERNVPAIELN